MVRMSGRMDSASAEFRALASPARLRDGGASLVEVLVAVLLLGLVGVGMLTLFAGTIRASNTNRILGHEQTWLASAEDLVASDAVAMPPCGSDAVAAYQAAIDALRTAGDATWPAGAVTVTAVERWVGSPAPGRFDPTGCVESSRLHRVTLSAKMPNGDVAKVLQMVKVGR
jgi:hypothetical protein